MRASERPAATLDSFDTGSLIGLETHWGKLSGTLLEVDHFGPYRTVRLALNLDRGSRVRLRSNRTSVFGPVMVLVPAFAPVRVTRCTPPLT